jgi:hypothetical protein
MNKTNAPNVRLEIFEITPIRKSKEGWKATPEGISTDYTIIDHYLSAFATETRHKLIYGLLFL